MNAGVVPVVAAVVEGHGEVAAVPVLIRAVATHLGHQVVVPPPFRRPRAELVRPAELNRAVRLVSQRVRSTGGTLVLLDADDDCPVELRSRLSAGLAVSHGRVEVVVANREFEAWFLASITSLRGHSSVADHASWESDPDLPRDAKKRLEQQMVESYKATRHQPGFSARLDVAVGMAHSRSFRHFVGAVDLLLSRDAS